MVTRGKKILNVKIKHQSGIPEKRPAIEIESGYHQPEVRLFGSSLYRTKDIRQLFLTSVAAIYFIAFLSIYLQIEGLYGTSGVTPAHAELRLGSRSSGKCLKDTSSLLCIMPELFGIDTQHAMELAAIVGILVGTVAILSPNCCTLPVYVIMWVLYFSIYQVGSIFMSFQWDILLLETGFIAILYCPWFPTKNSMASKPRDLAASWMIKWLLFRLMFASGVVKLSSSCPTWWGLTALQFHFESQCLPTPLAYYAHFLPSWFLQLMVIGTYYIEIVVPFFFFAPMKTLRRFSFWLQVFFQVCIVLTGNYNFFNLLTLVLCISLLDSKFFGYDEDSENQSGISGRRFMGILMSCAIICFSIYYTGIFFGVKLKDNTLVGRVSFTRTEYDWFISVSVPFGIFVGFTSLVTTLFRTILMSLFDVEKPLRKLSTFFYTVLYGSLCLGLFGLTLVPFSTLHRETNQAIWPAIHTAHSQVYKYNIANGYGLFRRMTGTDNGRPEVILEYSDSVNGPWKEYYFLYKPGNVAEAPRFIFPHQPRLDWQLWFAAISSYENSPYVLSMSYRLLNGDKSVEQLLDTSKLPLMTPKYIRASLYKYTFTKPQSDAAIKGHWWSRKREKEYMPVQKKSVLTDFMERLGYLAPDFKPPYKNQFLTLMLDRTRETAQTSRPEYLIWGSLLSLSILKYATIITMR